MKKCLAAALSAAMLLVTFVLPSSATAGENTLQESFNDGNYHKISYGFEDDAYNLEPDGDTTFSLDESTENVHGGSKALKVTFGKTTHKRLLTPENETYQLKRGKTYHVSLWLKVDKPQVGSLALCPYVRGWFNDDNAAIAYFNEGNAVTSTEYTQYTATFTVPDDANKRYFAFGFISNYKVENLSTVRYLWIDDIEISEDVPSVVTCYDGTTPINQLKGMAGSALALSNPKKEGSAFDGWYTDSTFTTPFTAQTFPYSDVKLYAKFKDTTVTQDFEKSFGIWTSKSAGCESFVAEVYTAESTGDSNVYGGNSSLKLTQKAGTGLVSLAGAQDSLPENQKLQKGKSYRITFWAKWANEENADLSNLSLYSSAYSSQTAIWDGREGSIGLGYRAKFSGLIEKDKWKEISATLTAARDGYLALNLGLTGTLYIDDLTVTEVTPQTDFSAAIAKYMHYEGTSVRPEEGDVSKAIRFKSSISKSFLENGIRYRDVSYTVAEYGHAYFKADLLNGQELDTAINYGTATPKEAVAYSKADNKNIYFDEDENNIYFTAALMGFTDEQLATEYVARPYVKLSVAGSSTTVTVYAAATQYSSLAEVAECAYYAQPGDIYDLNVAYTDQYGYQWSESYDVRKGLYNSVLSKLDFANYRYLAPADAAQ